MSWPFLDLPNARVFTSKLIAEEGGWIQYVRHDFFDGLNQFHSEGAWQFHSTDRVLEPISYARVATLESILKLDPTISALSDLPIGWHAWRSSMEDRWHCSPMTM